ncbi:PH-domain-containing protein [Piromyces finnis]|uniref:PH-domain-containing protein n=1 Tax=Piromyces finnis TaxID=1754191 RepID=A0A1Y1UVJ8_9FUNG|nr:PH-domain-containing protein [Piromyces finnis]|eukprot:ORX41630.1 PH-domain-containing protein [Piromyces finnis]
MIVYEECPANNGCADDSFSNDELDSDTEIENALAIINTEINEKIIKSGYLKKKGEKRKIWKRRWFVLRSNRLSYYKNEKEYKLLKVIPLDDINSVYNCENQQKYLNSSLKSDNNPVSPKPPKQNLSNAFYINTNDRSFLLQAQSMNDRNQWIKALNSTISTKKTNAHDFLVNNNIISKVDNLDQNINNDDNASGVVNQTQINNFNSNNNINIFDNTQQYGSNEEIEKMNEMNDIVSQIPKVNVKEDYSKVYYISNNIPKIQKSKSTKAVNFSTSAPSVHILMDEESDNGTEELKDEELSYEEFKNTIIKDENGDIICNNEENLEFFNSDEILNAIEKKLKYENEINNLSSPTSYSSYSMNKPISMVKSELESFKPKGKPHVGFISKEKLEVDDDDDDDEDDDEDEDDDDDNDDDEIISSSYDERNPIYIQKKEFLKQQMEKDVVVQQGYMYQYRKNALKKKWKKYWFVIRSGNLFIYKNEQEYVVKSIIPLENTLAICEVKRTSRIGRKGKKNRIRYCYQLIQSITPKIPEKNHSFDSISSSVTSISNESLLLNKNTCNEPSELSSSYSSSASNQNAMIEENVMSPIDTLSSNTLSSNKQNSVSQLTNKLENVNINENKTNNNLFDNNNKISKIEENNKENNRNIDNTLNKERKLQDEDIDAKKKKTTSILKINIDNRNVNNLDSTNNLDDLNKNRGKRGSLINTMSPNNNLTTPITPRKKTFVKVFTFSAPTETSRKIWIANLLNECEKVQEK